MDEHRDIPEPGELVYAPRPSWAPIALAAGIAVMVCGVYAEGFMVRGWIYSIIGAIVFLFAFRSLVKGAVRDYFRLPRKQRVRGAVLPVETISVPRD
ncbi:MAG TPA: hypothetical protein VNM89_04960 [Solirubrobacterales bacterium]|nr:hypothetical protein [Solirubrobacterales bacterium]